MANAPQYPARPQPGRPGPAPQGRPYPPQYGAPARPRPAAPYGAQMGNQYGQGSPYARPQNAPMRPVAQPAFEEEETSGSKEKYTRRPMAFFVFLMSLLFLAVVVVSYFAESIYADLVLYKNLQFGKNISFIDPIFGLLNVIKPGIIASTYYDLYLVTVKDQIAFQIAFYGLPVAIILAVICAIVLFIKGILAMSGKKDKVKFGFWATFMLVLCIFMAVTAIIANGAGLADSIKPLMGTGAIVNVAYGYYGVLGLSLLAFLFSIFSAGKRKE